jgi:hypothetical protein
MLKSGKRRREYPLKVNRFILPKHQGPLLKYIPSKESMYHIEAARNAILLYIHETGKADFVDGKMIFARKSLKKNTESSLVDYRIVAHFIPKYLQK